MMLNTSLIDTMSMAMEEPPLQFNAALILYVRYFLVRIFYPCLLIWGTIGNGLCLRVLLSKKFAKNSTCQYLAVMAVIDILFIGMRSSRHVYRLFRDTTIFNISKWVCRILTFFSSALAHLASWILVIVSFDRYFIVTSRYRRSTSTINRVFVSTTVLIGIVVLCNLYYFFILGRSMTLGGHGIQDHRKSLLRLMYSSNETSAMNSPMAHVSTSSDLLRYKFSSIFVCIPSSKYETFFRTYIPIFDILLVAVIPFLLLCFSNLAIFIFTLRSNRRMQHSRQHSSQRRHQRLTIMLLSVTLAFIGLTCPSVIFICWNKIIYSRRIGDRKDGSSEGSTIGPPPNVQLIIDICEALWYTKHAMNFILYTLSGQDFRREFLTLFKGCCLRRRISRRKILNKSLDESGSTVLTAIPLSHSSSASRPDGKKTKRSFLNDPADPSSVILLDRSSILLKSVSDE